MKISRKGKEFNLGIDYQRLMDLVMISVFWNTKSNLMTTLPNDFYLNSPLISLKIEGL
jgi:hypothetical protein